MRFRATLELHGKTATGFVVPAEVVEALGGGKRPAVRVTIQRHSCCFSNHRMLGGLHDAEEALQDALLRAWKGLPGFDGRSALRPAGVALGPAGLELGRRQLPGASARLAVEPQLF
jgi:hypothetical protein